MLKTLLVFSLALALAAVLPAQADIQSGFDFAYARQDQARLSPDGEYIAVVTSVSTLPDTHNLVTLRLSDGLAKAVTGFSDTDVGSFFWANDDRLVISTDRDSDATGGLRVYSGSYTIGRDGTGGRKVSQPGVRGQQFRAVTPPQLLHRLPTDWKNVLIARTDSSAAYPAVFLLDVETGRTKKVASNKLRINRWLADNIGNVRAAVDQGDDVLDGRERLLYRDKPDSDWRQLVSYDAADLRVLAFHADNRRLIVLADIGPDGADSRQALYLMNSDGQRVKTLVSDNVYDAGNLSGGAAGLKQTSQGRLVYYQYMADRLTTIYFDPRWQARQARIDEALADTVNTIIDWSDDERKLLVLSRGESNSGDYYLFDTTRQELKYLDPPAKWVKGSR